MINKMKAYIASKCRAIVTVVGVGVVTAISCAPAQAALDFTGASTALTAEINPAITAAMPFMGLILAATVGVKLFKRFVK